jgi:hypothetical protein
MSSSASGNSFRMYRKPEGCQRGIVHVVDAPVAERNKNKTDE